MSKDVRRRGHRRARIKKGNWFTRMKMWQRVLLCTGMFVFCLVCTAATYVYAMWSKIDTQDIKADDLIINDEVKMNREVDLHECRFVRSGFKRRQPWKREPHGLYYCCQPEQ